MIINLIIRYRMEGSINVHRDFVCMLRPIVIYSSRQTETVCDGA